MWGAGPPAGLDKGIDGRGPAVGEASGNLPKYAEGSSGADAGIDAGIWSNLGLSFSGSDAASCGSGYGYDEAADGGTDCGYAGAAGKESEGGYAGAAGRENEGGYAGLVGKESKDRFAGAAGRLPGINEVLPRFFASHGMPEHLASEIRGHLESFLPQVTPQPGVTYLHPEAPLRMGGRDWLPLITGGHAPGHVSLYHAASGQLICGDAVLPQISPNVSLLPGSDPQPLLTFLEGLRCLRSYPVSMAFPGHREPFSGFTARVDSLLRHHEERLQQAEALLAAGPLSGFAVCEALFRGRVTSVHQLRFAMSEALAHLAELVRQERAVLTESSSGILFAAAPLPG
ncbi:hypothetical protein B9T62_25550 [Paenibacillus donghaensis]|uniref:Uncharacterized protein n=2 Tax=Paenibacillus donghaensis TaxID=414771 RepID=A0A2Z2KTG0_9BACL|nr:hypothetical protein B9T62_25550 [Paenibacillus donghaensis]